MLALTAATLPADEQPSGWRLPTEEDYFRAVATIAADAMGPDYFRAADEDVYEVRAHADAMECVTSGGGMTGTP